MMRGGLIGCGYISSQQLQAWEEVIGGEIVAVCDLEREKAQAQATRFNIPAVYTDYKQMLADSKLDFIDIATRPANHLELVTAAARQHLHVLCQKPIAESLEIAEEMVAVCDKAGVMLMVNENGRFQGWFRHMKQLIDQDRLGQLRGARFDNRWRSTLPVPNFEGQDYFAAMPHLLVFEMGVHYLDIARFLFGEARSIFASLRRVSPHISGEDAALLIIEFNDLLCQVDANWYAYPPTNEPGITWGMVTIEGTDGTLTLLPNGTLSLNSGLGMESWHYDKETILHSFIAAQQHFIDCLHSGAEPETSGRNSLKTMALVFGAYQANEANRPVNIQTTDSSNRP